MPGYWVTAVLADKVGRKPIQFFSSFLLTTIFAVIGIDF